MSSIPSLKSLQNIFFDESKCIEYLFEKGVICKQQRCKFCNSEISTYIKLKLFRCKNKNCFKAFSILKDTIFSESKVKVSDILFIGYLWLCRVNFSSIKQITGYNHSSNTIIKFIKLFQDLAISTLIEEDYIIGGKNIIINLDESKFKRFESWWVFGGVELTKERKCFFQIVENRDKETFKKIIQKYVRQGSIVHTDHHKAYVDSLKKLNLRHKRVCHSKGHKGKGGIHSNHIEGTWSSVKKFISVRNRDKRVIDKYLKLFIWFRKNKNNLFNSFLEALKK